MSLPIKAYPLPEAAADRQLPSGASLMARSVCQLARPCLTQPLHTPRFVFHEASLLQVLGGRLDLDAGIDGSIDRLSVDDTASLLLVEPNTCVDLMKTPDGPERPFRSVFMALPSDLLDAFYRAHPEKMNTNVTTNTTAPFHQIPFDDDLAATWLHVCNSAASAQVSDTRLHYRLMDLLTALAERGHRFRQTGPRGTAGRLRTLIGETPARHWTAHEAGSALAMSEATLRRRLAGEATRFEDVLIDTRMHHAMMLLQTTPLSIPRIALACGYQSRARFSERFRARFGYLPSSVR
ncbi:helix-turn-helix transcriptional regulator [Pigmentiphaga aceris]|uniref:Helix-turn-helix transcriptional regulator n=1 Tax=Pigmentiphaga aceris TaxID=1940612 RepID=A0A5C0AVV3_9BURK|nr:helix-turn-helix transcriptional regulator [Pigmentiphaga aceris]QEI05493.1 helix-turn-helix transcriptional regulator [Pigmentiphaga aceris]